MIWISAKQARKHRLNPPGPTEHERELQDFPPPETHAAGMTDAPDDPARLVPPPPLLLWEWLSPGELTVLQEQIELLPLLTLRTTSKAVRAGLDAAAPPAVQLARWILDQKIVESPCPYDDSNPAWVTYRDAHRRLGDEPHIHKAPTRVLIDTWELFWGMNLEINDYDTNGSVKRFQARWQWGLMRELRSRVVHLIEGDGGSGTLYTEPTGAGVTMEEWIAEGNDAEDYYCPMTAAEWAAEHGPPLPVSEDEAVRSSPGSSTAMRRAQAKRTQSTTTWCGHPSSSPPRVRICRCSST